MSPEFRLSRVRELNETVNRKLSNFCVEADVAVTDDSMVGIMALRLDKLVPRWLQDSVNRSLTRKRVVDRTYDDYDFLDRCAKMLEEDQASEKSDN